MGAHTGKYVVARKSFGYAGRHRDIGEVFKLKGMRNDDKIWGLEVSGKPKMARYTRPFRKDPGGLPRCAECGAFFINHTALSAHGNKRHQGD
jgi:hypothetical protein